MDLRAMVRCGDGCDGGTPGPKRQVRRAGHRPRRHRGRVVRGRANCRLEMSAGSIKESKERAATQSATRAGKRA